MKTWLVYILRCADDTFYTGITTDLARRLQEHNHHSRLASKYTKARRPVELAYYESSLSRSTASKREYQIRRLSRIQKERLLTAGNSKQCI